MKGCDPPTDCFNMQKRPLALPSSVLCVSCNTPIGQTHRRLYTGTAQKHALMHEPFHSLCSSGQKQT